MSLLPEIIRSTISFAAPNDTRDLEKLPSSGEYPIHSRREIYKIYVEDNFPWWELHIGKHNGPKSWSVIGCDGFEKKAKTSEPDIWLSSKTGMVSKRCYVLAEYYPSKKLWKAKLNHIAIPPAEFMRKAEVVFGDIDEISFEDPIYVVRVDFTSSIALSCAVTRADSKEFVPDEAVSLMC